MEFPYELENIFKRDNNGFMILESSIYDYINNYEKDYISHIIDYIGQCSNSERHLNKQITSSESFFNRNKNKTLLIKLEKKIIVGFILYDYRFVLLRNEFNLSYFSKILLTISDFYIFRNYQRMNYGKKLFDKLIQITKTKPVSMAFEFPNKALINFLHKNYNIGNPIYQINNIITYYSFNDQNFNKYLDDNHRPIDVNKMENDIDNYKKWSLFDKDYKIFN
jgi:ribosomal protein S18 acetylase RimI-like enzyme